MELSQRVLIEEKFSHLTAQIDATQESFANALAKQQFGQFFTPQRVSKLVAGIVPIKATSAVRVLDPGAGLGSLTVALCEQLILGNATREIEAILIEQDSALIKPLAKNLDLLKELSAQFGISLNFQIFNNDFFELVNLSSDLTLQVGDNFDYIIMNPPYGKLNAQSSARTALKLLGVDSPNLYSGFISLAIRLLKNDASFSAIVPRSFMNGTYFKRFREDLLSKVSIEAIHVFESRSSLFSKDLVLQETVIFSGTKKQQGNQVEIIYSKTEQKIESKSIVPTHKVILDADPDSFLHIPISTESEQDSALRAKLKCTLSDLELLVSTGPVVDFRCREHISREFHDGYVPLIQSGNVKGGVVSWPLSYKKPQYIDSRITKLLYPNQNYVLVKRFSSKEEKRRIVASTWSSELVPTEYVGFENHLNIIYKKDGQLSLDLAKGISCFLNSTLMDSIFREFSGHTQVNAGDLRKLKFPPSVVLEALGRCIEMELPEQETIDSLVTRLVEEF